MRRPRSRVAEKTDPALGSGRRTKSRIVFTTYPEIPGVELMAGFRVRDEFDAHMHECYTVGVTLEGTEHFRCRSAPYSAVPGDIALLNPCEVHEGGPGPEGFWSYRMIYVRSDVLLALGADLRLASSRTLRFTRTVVADRALAATIGSLQQAMDQAASSLERQCLVLEVLSALILRHAGAVGMAPHIGRESSAVARVRQYLHAEYERNIRLDDLSALTGLSPCHLLRSFRRAVGMPPHAYLRQVRVEHAKSMLANGVPIANAALAAGFTDQSHLTRFFKRILGMTPGAYVAGIRANQGATSAPH